MHYCIPKSFSYLYIDDKSIKTNSYGLQPGRKGSFTSPRPSEVQKHAGGSSLKSESFLLRQTKENKEFSFFSPVIRSYLY